MKWDERQKAYYRDLAHTHLQFDPSSTYAANIVDETFAAHSGRIWSGTDPPRCDVPRLLCGAHP
ncbi:MAG: hypothetical protein JWO97_4306, partial [Acidobacteria bacterium]|nr:hypothetical protein [Acidobacteriota bacterium]